KKKFLSEVAHEVVSSNLTFEHVAPIFAPLISGLLSFWGKDDTASYGLEGVEELIASATPEQFAAAREIYRFVTSNTVRTILDCFGIKIERDVFGLIRESVKSDPRWTSLILVLGLVLDSIFGYRFKLEDAQKFVREVDVPALVRMLRGE